MKRTPDQHVVLITGAAGYIGAMLVDIFSSRSDVVQIIGLDKEAAPALIASSPKLVYIQANTADFSWQKQAAELQPDVVIHTAWQIREMYGKRDLQYKWNISGSDNVFDFACATPSVQRLVHFSTVASYGAYSDNTIEHRFVESEPLRPTDYSYAEEKREVEEHLKRRFDAAAKAGSMIRVSVIRPASITGPRGRYMMVKFGLQAALSGQLKKSLLHRAVSLMVAFMPVTPLWCRQFIHEDDIADIVASLAFDQDGSGKAGHKASYEIYNACPQGDVVRGKDMADAVGKRTVPVSPWMVRLAFFCVRHVTFGKIPTSRGGWRAYSFPIVVDGSKLTRVRGYRYQYGPKDAFLKKEGRYRKYIA